MVNRHASDTMCVRALSGLRNVVRGPLVSPVHRVPYRVERISGGGASIWAADHARACTHDV